MIFSILFCFVLCTKDVSVTNVDFFEKQQLRLQFFFSLLQVYIVYRIYFIFHLMSF